MTSCFTGFIWSILATVMVEIQEPIDVWVFFSNFIQPHVFFWKNRRIKIDKINLVHTSKEGSSLPNGVRQAGLFYHFSVSVGNNVYLLKFDTQKLKWFIEAVDEQSY